MAQVFDSKHMIVSRGRVFNKHTGRWLGQVSDFTTGEASEETVPPEEVDRDKPFVDDLSKKELVAIAKEVALPGYSTLDKDQLKGALLEIGVVQEGSGMDTEEEADGEDQPGSEEASDDAAPSE